MNWIKTSWKDPQNRILIASLISFIGMGLVVVMKEGFTDEVWIWIGWIGFVFVFYCFAEYFTRNK